MTGSGRTRRPAGGTSLFVVLVLDPVTEELDSYGPYGYDAALAEAARRREEYDREDLGEVMILVVPLHPATPPTGT
ncbi:hypothetical protein [Actinomycetospora soli]|uniref:hypothetical protein n=1 Tax=Actinomycetospora soli TaxID=2893887 RepID=UPI001E3CF8C8|nr:hypothetical protein [Actinomycetospora soli]MCD2187939.1 hypothetical protein [Actinomycetospora soli]